MVTRERPAQPGTANRPVRRSEDTRLTSGVDAHKRVQAAVARDQAEREIDQWRGPNRLDGWEGLRDGSQALDAERPWGIEGAEPYGRGLAQLLVAGEETVVLEVLVAERASALTAATRVRNQLRQVLQQLDPEYHQR